MSEKVASTVNPAEFTFAFQPIVDNYSRSIYSYEALVRGLNGESAYAVISRYSAAQMPEFDAACRIKAIEVASNIGVSTHLNLNFLPTAALSADYGLSSTLAAAARIGFPADRLIIEATEGESIGDHAQFAEVINEYRRAGVRLAIDDFGAGYSGLNLLAEFQPDVVKLDMSLVRNIHRHGPRQAIVRAIAQVCTDLGIDFIVEGVESVEEYAWFNDQGVNLYQGYLFAKPLFEALPEFTLPPLN
ncbi:MAG TPA: EAL domain-containing protein [Marinagarivorans sp.]